MSKKNNCLKIFILIYTRIQYLTSLSVVYNRFKNWLHEHFLLYRTLKKFYNFTWNFIFNTLILIVFNIFNCAKFLLKRDAYATRQEDIGKTSIPYWIILKFDAKTQKQRPTKMSNICRDRPKLILFMIFLLFSVIH